MNDDSRVSAVGSGDSPPPCQIALINVRWAFHGDDTATEPIVLYVEGTADGVSRVEVLVSGDAFEQSVDEEADVDDDSWEAMVVLSAEDVQYGSRVTVKVTALESEECHAVAVRAVQLGTDPRGIPEAAAGCPSGLEERRNCSAAGYADRLVVSRAFSPPRQRRAALRWWRHAAFASGR